MLFRSGKECGYVPNEIFPNKYDQFENSRAHHIYSDYLGYWVLNRWRSDQIDRAIDLAIQSRIKLSSREAKFLRLCIQQTLFSGICADRVNALSSTAYSHIDSQVAKRTNDMALFGHQDNVVCSFVDGVAARRGLRLSKSINPQHSKEHR